ncbi:MAG TPA: 50S ribosomal protein L9, partial [Coriobacteriia bacterium]
KQLESRMENINKRNATRMGDAQSVATSIEGQSIVLEAKAGLDGKLFGSITTLMIEEAVAAQLGADIDHKRMDLHRPIKTTGEHRVVVSVFGDVKATLTVKVVPEGGAAALAAEEAAAAEAAVAKAAAAEAAALAAAELAAEEAAAAEAVAVDADETSDDESGDSDTE